MEERRGENVYKVSGGGGLETWRHVWEECVSWKAEGGWQEMMEKVLGEDGEGEVWMKE